ncbi:CRISPR-associated endonuclease Cas2 [Rhodocaloribacter litoris]|uniref:CRISPR-associated endonuclease Cas2 n=1 Tax=Rhodocaloribacter litoris TaxID=2558931 RepID=UPI0014217A8A|nr:CRISPR-associated endonuclease Cas2 [Rhodocaloribacter litoris]QXD14017.1 CRISPR-associated endonuclease Cas2 [Rhodocaloribacter litoris]
MPYYIAVYDINVRRVAKMLKLFRRYLTWVQRSVFEGELTEAQFRRLQHEVRRLMNPEEDVVIFYELRDVRYSRRLVLGTEQGHRDRFL